MGGMRARLLARSGGGGLLYVAELVDGGALPKMDHLVCYLPGLLALGHLHGINTGAKLYVLTSEVCKSVHYPIVSSCLEMC